MWFYTLSLSYNWKSVHATSQRVGSSTEAFIHCWWGCKLMQWLGTDITCKQPTTHTGDDPSITLLGNPREAIACVLQKPQASKFYNSTAQISKTLKPTKRLSVEEQMHTHNEVVYSYQVNYWDVHVTDQP